MKKQLLMLPGPTNVSERVMRAMQRPMINHRGPEFHELYDSLYEKCQYVFQTKNHVFVLTASGTGAVECSVSNILSPGDRVVVPVYGLFSQRLKEKIETFGGVPIEIPIEWGNAPTAEQVAEALEGQNVKAVAIVYNETATGVTVRDLKKIGKIAHDHDALLIVDAVSVLGGDELPVDEWGIDICAAGSQKCLACPPGIGLISVSDRAWETIGRTKRHAYYFSMLKMREFHEKKETPFTPALPLFFALEEALILLQEEGLENRIARHRECADLFYNRLPEIGLELFADERWRSNTLITARTPAGLSDKDVRKIMKERYGVVVAGGAGKFKGTMLRIGSMGVVTKSDVELTLESIEGALKELGYSP